jgi:hypothetical protein
MKDRKPVLKHTIKRHGRHGNDYSNSPEEGN